jgi:hypothetical protein
VTDGKQDLSTLKFSFPWETQEALTRFQDIAEQASRSEEERKRLGLEKNAFAVYIVLKSYVQGLGADQAKTVDAVFREYPNFCWDDNQASLLAQEPLQIRAVPGRPGEDD